MEACPLSRNFFVPMRFLDLPPFLVKLYPFCLLWLERDVEIKCRMESTVWTTKDDYRTFTTKPSWTVTSACHVCGFGKCGPSTQLMPFCTGLPTPGAKMRTSS